MQTISAAKTIYVEINRLGRIYLPYIYEIENKKIKYIDMLDSFIHVNDINIQTLNRGLYFTMLDVEGNMFYDNVPVENFNSMNYFLGIRKHIDRKIIIQNCFIENNNSANIGRYIAITFYYEDNKYNLNANQVKYNKELIEVIVNSQNAYVTNIKFPDIRTFAGKRLRSIRAAYNNVTSYIITPLGYQSVKFDNNNSIFLTLKNGSYVICDKLPLSALNEQYKFDPIVFENILVNLPDSYITIVWKNNTNVPNTTYSIPLIFEYMED